MNDVLFKKILDETKLDLPEVLACIKLCEDNGVDEDIIPEYIRIAAKYHHYIPDFYPRVFDFLEYLITSINDGIV
jgi:hypothetical protein